LSLSPGLRLAANGCIFSKPDCKPVVEVAVRNAWLHAVVVAPLVHPRSSALHHQRDKPGSLTASSALASALLSAVAPPSLHRRQVGFCRGGATVPAGFPLGWICRLPTRRVGLHLDPLVTRGWDRIPHSVTPCDRLHHHPGISQRTMSTSTRPPRHDTCRAIRYPYIQTSRCARAKVTAADSSKVRILAPTMHSTRGILIATSSHDDDFVLS